jgi:hypothetical protein
MRKASLFVTIALVGQIVLGSIANAAVIADNKVGTEMTAFRLGNTATFAQTLAGQQSGAGSFSNGSVSDYPEGSCIPGLVKVKNKDNVAGDIVFSPSFDYLNTAVGIDHLEGVTSSLGAAVATADDLSDLTLGLNDLSTVTSFTTLSGGSVSAVITGPVSNGTNGGTQMKKYGVTLQNVPAGETVLFLTCARLGTDASEFNGATLSLRLSGGNENIGISTNQLLVLPTLTIVKEVVGGTLAADQWSFNVSPTINGNSDFATTLNQDGTASVTIENVPVDGAYTVTESGPSGYTVSAGSGSLNCTFSGGTATGTLAAGKPATDATCVFVNTYDAPPAPTTGNVTVTKVVTNDDGGAKIVSDFPLSVGQTAVVSGATNAFAAGTYAITESGATGYTATYTGDCDALGNLTVVAGQSYSCTITNDDVAATLTVNKIVSGGPLTAGDFPLFVDQTQVVNGVAASFDAGSYAVSETGAQDYAATFSGDCDAQGNITLGLGDVKQCTITNTSTFVPEETGTITVVKVVAGGDAQVSDFPLFIGQTSVTSGSAETLPVGNYTVSETNAQANYVGSFSGDCDENGNVSLGADQDLTCTITNTYNPPAPTTGNVTVTKIVINDDETASSQVSDFILSVGETQVTSGATNAFAAGSYVVSESGPSGYTATFSGGCDENGNITVVAGESVTCTITNNDNARPPQETGTLTVVKVVINNNGGEAEISDFPLFIDQTQVTSGSSHSLPAGQYVVSETSSADYVSSFSGDCDVNGVVSLEVGDEKTCTITNDDKANNPPGGGGSAPQTGTLIVVTDVINDGGGEAMPSSFLMTVGDGVSVSSTFGGQNTPGFSMAQAPGAFVVNGSTSPSYTQSKSANCAGTLSAGQTLTCVVTYTYQAPPTGGSPTPPSGGSPSGPVPQVLGDTDTDTTDAGPIPQVLGATDDDLPVTGMPAWTLSALLLAAAPFLRRKRA